MQFFLIYIREAHALDGASPNTRPGAPLVEDPVSEDERAIVATECAAALDLGDMEILIDDMDDTANTAYAGHPDRLYLVNDAGVVAYQGGPGPRGFDPDEWEDAIRSELGLEPIEREPQERPRQRQRRGGR